MKYSKEHISVLIADDESVARSIVRKLLEQLPYVRDIFETRDGLETVIFLKKKKPDLVILDIKMPGLNGFAVINSIGLDHMPATIFSTAYNHFAVKAFEANAVDYLVKPYNDERFISAIEKAYNMINADIRFNDKLKKIINSLENEQRYLEKIIVKESGTYMLLDLSKVLWFEAASDYIKIHLNQDYHLIRETMKHIESSLNPDVFIRIHRSSIVNINCVTEIARLSQKTSLVKLDNGTELKLSSKYKKNFMLLFDPSK